MNPRTAYLTQIIEKIGSPLLDAVTFNAAKAQNEGLSKEQAEQLAVLLSKTVQLSINLGKMIEIEKSEPELSDSLRVAMAGLASPIIASQYKHLSKSPSDDDISKLGNALEAVMTFSDNFTPSAENAERLKTLAAEGAPADTHQINIQYIQAFVPVADVISRFPFGQAEKKMVQDAAEKITNKAKTIYSDVFGENPDKDIQKFHELGIVKALAEIYTNCHEHEMNKLLAMQEPDANAQSQALEALWGGFETRCETLRTLAENLTPPKSVGTQQNSSGPSAAAPAAAAPIATNIPPQASTPPAAEQPPAVQPQVAQPTENTPPASAPPQEAAAQQPPQQSSGNPMSMFAKPKTGDAAQAPTPVSPPPASEGVPQASAPPSEQQQQPPSSPQNQAPPTEQQGDAAQSGGGPMSFFKTPPKDDEEQ